MAKLTPRALDHVVFPVPDLEVARARYEQLGFTVAPDGRHKFGTENACVKFADGAFIEPLAIGHRETVEAHMVKGNNFLRRDASYRFRHGNNGFWGVSLSTKDSAADRKMLRKAGYNTGKLVTVKRKGVHARLSFALDERAPDFSIFMCQDMMEAPVFKAELLSHANGAKGISRVTLCEHLPEDFQYYLQTATGQREVRSHSFGMDMALSNVTLSVLNAEGMNQYYGVSDILETRGLRAQAIDVEVKNLKTMEEILSENSISFRQIGPRLIVDPAKGQGALIAFVEG